MFPSRIAILLSKDFRHRQNRDRFGIESTVTNTFTVACRCVPLALKQRGSAEVLAVEMKKIEGEQHQPMSGLVDRRAQGIEVGYVVLVLSDKLAVDDGSLAR
jgi:hypothetical protein